jgi:hypothetical protein
MPTAASLATWAAVAFRPVPAASLVAFRIVLGATLLWEVRRYLRYGWLERYWVDPIVRLPYEGFGWLPTPSLSELHLVFAILAGAGVAIAAGLATRIAAAVATLSFGYLFLLEATRYLNHLYLFVLLLGLAVVLPLDRRAALGPWLRRRWRGDPPAEGTVPAWSLWLVRVQIGIPYVYGGLAKLNGDWLQGEPIRAWMQSRADLPAFGRFVSSEPGVFTLAYGGLAFDLLAPFAIAWKRTRVVALTVMIAFHLANAYLFSIGIFPFLMIAASLAFLPADWPVRLARWIRTAPWTAALAAGAGAGAAWIADPHGPWIDPEPLVFTALAFVVLAFEARQADARTVAARGPTGVAAVDASTRASSTAPGTGQRGRIGVRRAGVLVALIAWVGVQGLVPLRHHVLPGDVAWNEAGHRFSWRMKLRSKSGDVVFEVTATDGSWTTRDRFEPFLESWQSGAVATHPYLTLRFAHALAERYAQRGWPGVEVRAIGAVSLNGREPQPLIDPTVNLAALPIGTSSSGSWVTESPRRR